jgi:hypothetical protein
VNVLSSRSESADVPAGHIVPEFVPWVGSADGVANLAIELLRDPQKLGAQRQQLMNLVRPLDHPGASMNVARLALEMMHANQQK